MWLPLPQYSSRRSEDVEIIWFSEIPRSLPPTVLSSSLWLALLSWLLLLVASLVAMWLSVACFTAEQIQLRAFSFTCPLGLLKELSSCSYDKDLPSERCKTSVTWVELVTKHVPWDLPIMPNFVTWGIEYSERNIQKQQMEDNKIRKANKKESLMWGSWPPSVQELRGRREKMMEMNSCPIDSKIWRHGHDQRETARDDRREGERQRERRS